MKKEKFEEMKESINKNKKMTGFMMWYFVIGYLMSSRQSINSEQLRELVKINEKMETGEDK